MREIYNIIGIIVCGLGGGLLALAVLALLVNAACVLFIKASCRFRNICKAESMIFEYKKNRNDFMYWYHMQKGDNDAAD